jgi:hypothetical protein
LIGLALLHKLPLWQVVRKRELKLDGQALPLPSANLRAGQRLGEEPLVILFGLLTGAWSSAQDPRVRALRVPAADGVAWSAPDTLEIGLQLGSCSVQHGPLPWP